MIHKIETARNLARAIWSSAPTFEAITRGPDELEAMLSEQGNTIQNGRVLIGMRWHKIHRILSETRPGEKYEYSRP